MSGDVQYDHRDRSRDRRHRPDGLSRNSGRSDLTRNTGRAGRDERERRADAGQHDGIVRCDMDTVRQVDLIDVVGMPNVTYWADVGPGGVAAAAMVGQAVAAILSGQATSVLVFHELNGRSGRRYGLSSATTPRVGGAGSYDELYVPYGLLTPGQVFALFAQRHMAEFGTKPEQLARIRSPAGPGPTPTPSPRCTTARSPSTTTSARG